MVEHLGLADVRGQVLAMAEELGWTVTSNRPGKGARWDTGVPAPGASASVLDDVVADLQIRMSERVEEDLANGSELEVGASTASCFWVLTSPKFVETRRDLGPE